MCKVYFQLLFLGFVLAFSPTSYAGKKQCKAYLVNLRNIQSQQKQGHNLKRNESLNKREAKARNKWWRCERGLLTKMVSRKSKNNNQNDNAIKRQSIPVNTVKNDSKVNIKPFSTTADVMIKSRYQGLQLYAWLEYYQQPKKCSRPKSTKQFAFCVEDRRRQQLAFDTVYKKSDATLNVK